MNDRALLRKYVIIFYNMQQIRDIILLITFALLNIMFVSDIPLVS